MSCRVQAPKKPVNTPARADLFSFDLFVLPNSSSYGTPLLFHVRVVIFLMNCSATLLQHICGEKHLKSQSPPHQQILSRLLKYLILEKACRKHGFYLGSTAVKSIGKDNNNNDDNNHQEQVLTVPVCFTCRTFLPAKGDILQGIVMKVLGNRVFIGSGPLRYAYMSSLKISDYQYFPSKSEDVKPYFQKDDLTKIAVGVVVRFKVLAVRFKERPDKNDIYVLGTTEDDDTVGPISLTGSDEPYM